MHLRVDVKVWSFERSRVRLVEVDELLAVGEGAAVEVKDGGAAGGAALQEQEKNISCCQKK